MDRNDPMDGLTRDSIRALLVPEMRTVAVPLQDLEWRESGSGDGSRILSGYAAVFGQRTTLYSGKYYQLDEQIEAGAFGEVLASNPEVHLNIGHDMTRAIARLGIRGMGGLELSEDAHGLRVYARLNPDDPDVMALSAKMGLGIMDQMSFAFRMGATTELTETDEAGRETDLLTIQTVSALYDVCVCAQGAYPTTEAALRSLMLAGNGGVLREVTPAEIGAQDAPVVEEATSGAEGTDPSVERARALLIAEGSVALSRFRTKEELKWTE